MKLTPEDCARLDAATAAGQAPPAAPALPGLAEEPTPIATLIRYRRERLAL